MESERGNGVKLGTPYMDYIETVKVVPLRYAIRAPLVPGPDRYAPTWEIPTELATPSHVPRALRQIHHFKDLSQDLGLDCYKYFKTCVRRELVIDWRTKESNNIRLPAHEISGPSDEDEVDDLRSFLGAIYGSTIVTAMEMARILYDIPYDRSYRYSRDSRVNWVRGACWDVLPYARTESATTPHGTQVSRKPEEPKGPGMAVICIPPWELSRLDLQDFATQGTQLWFRFADGELKLTPGEMRTSKARILWAIVYDACKEARCSYFAVTAYDYWVFGNMSENYTTASVSLMFDFSERSPIYQRPNLLQLLTYRELVSIGAASWDISLDDVVNRG